MLLAGIVMADLSLLAGGLDGEELKTGQAAPLTTSAKEHGGGVGILCWDSGVSGTTEQPWSLLLDLDLGGVEASDSAWGGRHGKELRVSVGLCFWMVTARLRRRS